MTIKNTNIAIAIQSIMITFLFLSNSFAESIYMPQRLMEETSSKMIKAFMDNTDVIRKDNQIAHKMINDNLVSIINFSFMSRWVLGKNWKKATQHQQQEFINEFKQLVVQFYSQALLQYFKKNDLSENIITFKPFRKQSNNKYATVRSQVNPPSGGKPIKVNYALYLGKLGTWQVYDVSVEGISLVTTYRSSFRQIIKQKGMDALLSELHDKNSKYKLNISSSHDNTIHL